MNKYPFDLKRALAGDPIVTEDGREAKIIEEDLDSAILPIKVEYGAKSAWHDRKGQAHPFLSNPDRENARLFMATPASAPKTAPFDAIKALNGHPLITRGGNRDVKNLQLDPDPDNGYSLIFNFGDSGPRHIAPNGRFFANGTDNENDLFLLIEDEETTEHLKLAELQSRVAVLEDKLNKLKSL